MDLTDLKLSEIRDLLRRKEVSAADLVRTHLERIDRVDSAVRAYLTLSPERAMEQAIRVDKAIAAGEPVEPLAGVPTAVKDVILTRGTRATCGSKILSNYIAPYDATAVTR